MRAILVHEYSDDSPEDNVYLAELNDEVSDFLESDGAASVHHWVYTDNLVIDIDKLNPVMLGETIELVAQLKICTDAEESEDDYLNE